VNKLQPEALVRSSLPLQRSDLLLLLSALLPQLRQVLLIHLQEHKAQLCVTDLQPVASSPTPEGFMIVPKREIRQNSMRD